MSKVPRTPHRRASAISDADDEALRRALNEARAVIRSVKGILNAASKAGFDIAITGSALEQFISGRTTSLKPANREMLTRFLFRSALGRALRSPAPGARSSYDYLIDVLSSGNYGTPSQIDATGLYFLYHGSYVRAGYFAVHVLDIECIDGGILSATDSLRDNRSQIETVLEGRGCVIFTGNTPHIILEAKDNKTGLCLIVAHGLNLRQNTIVGFTGTFMGMTKGCQSFHRHCIAYKGTEDPTETSSRRRQSLQPYRTTRCAL